MSRFHVRDGLVTIALFFVITLTLFTPLSLLTVWFLPLPFLLYAAKHGWLSALLPAGIGALSLWAVSGHPLNVGWVMAVAVTGITMGELYRRSQTTGTDVVLGGLTAVWVGSLLLLVIASFSFNMMDRLDALLAQEWEQNKEMLRAYGMEDSLPELPPVAAVIPGMIFLLAVPIPLLNLVVGRRWLRRRGFPGKYLPPFGEWRLPRPFFYFYFVSLLLLILFGLGENANLMLLGNAAAVLFTLFIVQGLAFITWLLERSGKSKGWLVLVVFLTLLIPVAGMVVHLIGIVDCGTRIRNRIRGEK